MTDLLLVTDKNTERPKTGYRFGRRTYYSLEIIDSILRDVDRGHVQFPVRFVESLRSQKKEIEGRDKQSI